MTPAEFFNPHLTTSNNTNDITWDHNDSTVKIEPFIYEAKTGPFINFKALQEAFDTIPNVVTSPTKVSLKMINDLPVLSVEEEKKAETVKCSSKKCGRSMSYLERVTIAIPTKDKKNFKYYPLCERCMDTLKDWAEKELEEMEYA